MIFLGEPGLMALTWSCRPPAAEGSAKVFKEVMGVTPSQFANEPNLVAGNLEALDL